MSRPFPLSGCGGGWETLERLRRLYQDRDRSLVLAAFGVPSPARQRLAARWRAGFCDYPDPRQRVAFWAEFFQERAALCDDSVPAAYLSEFDQGLYGGLLGGDARFLFDPATGFISSMIPPLLEDLAHVDRLAFRPDDDDKKNPWWRRYREQLDVFARGAAGKFGLSHFILIDGLNFCFELVGGVRYVVSGEPSIDEANRLMDAVRTYRAC